MAWKRNSYISRLFKDQTVKEMKIRELEIHPLSIPLKEPFTISLGTIEESNNVIIRIKTDEFTGYGEAAPAPRITGDTQNQIIEGLKHVKKILIGKDPFDIIRIEEEIDRALRGNHPLKNAVDMALLDLIGKEIKKPVYKFLGGYRSEFRTDFTIGIKKPDEMAKDAIKIVEDGFDTIKIKVGVDPEEDIERIKRIRDAVGYKIKLRADANQGWSPKEAVKAVKSMEKYDLELIEQPVPWWNIKGLRWVRERVDIPVMADESVFSPQDALKLIEEKAVDMFNIKLMKCGGITNGIKIANIAEAAGMECMVGCMSETGVAITAASHLVASARNITRADLDSSLTLVKDPAKGGVKIERGKVILPDGDGLGIEDVVVS